MNKEIILIVAAILMAPMIGRNDVDPNCTDPKLMKEVRQNCLGQAIQLWADLEKLIEQAQAEADARQGKNQ